MINEQIRDREVRVVSESGEQLGIMSAREAMKLAQEAELDLVKIAPTAKPPVCKIIDYGKYRYEQARKEKEAKNEKLAPEVQKIIDQGDAFIRKIHECNEAIPGEEISAKISRMEMLVDRIFDRVEENPQSVSDIRKLMEYYLPTTIKLLEAYEQLDRQPVDGENIQTAKREIEATLDTLNTAFEKLLDDLFQDTMWDVSSDISVLNTMLAQEGLKEDGMKK